jgi:hypothetical protein
MNTNNYILIFLKYLIDKNDKIQYLSTFLNTNEYKRLEYFYNNCEKYNSESIKNIKTLYLEIQYKISQIYDLYNKIKLECLNFEFRYNTFELNNLLYLIFEFYLINSNYYLAKIQKTIKGLKL